MNLPNADKAIVEPSKVTSYLLAFDHPEGAGKAVCFTHYGFVVSEWQILAEALLSHARSHPAAATFVTAHGTKYRIEGSLECADGRLALIRSIWIVDIGSDVPRLVTAYLI